MDGRVVVIETEQLTKIYNGQTAVDRLSLEIAEGEVFGFLGPNGAGKTTTLLMLLGLTEPSGGKARVLGFDPTREPIKVKTMVGYLQENMGFYRDLSAVQTLRFIAELNNVPERLMDQRIEEVLEQVGLDDQVDKRIETYSRGMRQRLGLAEVLLKQPRIAFLDEPTLGLDPEGTNQMLELVASLARKRKLTVILSSHLLYQAQRICTRVGIMIGGSLVADGTMEQLAAEQLGVDNRENTLEQIYMKYFKEEQQ